MSNRKLRKDAVDVRIKLLGIITPRASSASASDLIAAAEKLEDYVYRDVSDGGSDASIKLDEADETSAPSDAEKDQGKSAPKQKEDPASRTSQPKKKGK